MMPEQSSNHLLAWLPAGLAFCSAAFWGAKKAVNYAQRMRENEAAIARINETIAKGEKDRSKFMEQYSSDREKDEKARQQLAVVLDRTNLIYEQLNKR